MVSERSWEELLNGVWRWSFYPWLHPQSHTTPMGFPCRDFASSFTLGCILRDITEAAYDFLDCILFRTRMVYAHEERVFFSLLFFFFLSLFRLLFEIRTNAIRGKIYFVMSRSLSHPGY